MKAVEQFAYLMPQRDGQGSVTGWMWLYNGGSGTGSLPPILAEGGSGKNDIYFTVVDPQKHIKFSGYDGPNAAAAISIGPKTTPPTKPTTISTGGEFSSVGFHGQDGITLKLEDKNQNNKEFVYALNFVDSTNNSPVLGIDPEIRNGGGGQGIGDAVFHAFVVAVITAALTVMFVRLALGWRRVAK